MKLFGFINVIYSKWKDLLELISGLIMAKYLSSKPFWSIIGYLIKLDWADLSNVIKLTNSWFNKILKYKGFV